VNCHEFEIRLWEKPGKYRDRESLPEDMLKHLEGCPSCQAAYAGFLKLFEISRESEMSKSPEYWQDFDSKVWQKIEESGVQDQAIDDKSVIRFRGSRIGIAQVLASLGVAAVTVLFMVMAISNITQEPEIPGMMKKGEVRAGRSAAKMHTQAPMATYDVVLNRGADGALEIKEFSLLPEPEVNVIDTSALVSIDEAYLTDEGLDKEEVAAAKALSKELVTGKGVADTSYTKMKAEMEPAPESDYVITVEKMPKMIKAVPPSYPALAYRLKKGGDVWIKARVDAQGNVDNALIHKESGTDYGFEEAALAAAYKNKFEPFEVNGKNVPVWVIYRVRFVAKE
jgi:TonB family protein